MTDSIDSRWHQRFHGMKCGSYTVPHAYCVAFVLSEEYENALHSAAAQRGVQRFEHARNVALR